MVLKVQILKIEIQRLGISLKVQKKTREIPRMGNPTNRLFVFRGFESNLGNTKFKPNIDKSIVLFNSIKAKSINTRDFNHIS